MVAVVSSCPPERRMLLWIAALIVGSIFLGGCSAGPDLQELGSRYAAAWSSQDPDRLASFYAEDGVLRVNGNESTGRAAIRETVAGFMEAFPDMRVAMDSITTQNGHPVFHWHWTGTNTGPGGTGRSVDLLGREEWTLRPDGLIALSDGHFDETEYRLQLDGEGA